MALRLLAIIIGFLVACSAPAPGPAPGPASPGPTPPAPSQPPPPDRESPAPERGELKPAGTPCLAAFECDSGICEGEGCTDDRPGTCAPKARGCTRDLRTYCGCDGKTFRTSGSCPGQRFSARAECPGA